MKRNVKNKMIAVLILMLISVAALTACGKCEHSYKEGVCVKCGVSDPDYVPVCTHSYVNGVCIECGNVCSHSYTEGVCSECKFVCRHVYIEGVCDECRYECPHSYVNGVCTKCGNVCSHSFKDGVCSDCGTACAHTYAEGKCSECGTVCSHSYVDSVCSECGISCTHNFGGGVCSLCGAADPNHVPADGGISMYREIVEKYKALVLYKYVNEELPPKKGEQPFYVDTLYTVVAQFDTTKDFGYAFKDINGDGYFELLLTENANRLYAMFTIVDKAPVLVTTFQQGMGYLGSGGLVFYNSKSFDTSGGQIYLGYHMTHLVDGKLVGFTYGWEDADGDYATQNDEIYYLTSEDGVKKVLSYDEYKAFRSPYTYYWESATRLTKLNGLRCFSALTDSYFTDITADFSTYDSIIKTFGLMHSSVTGGKCVRSKWISGAYDGGMIFENEEDFVIYNKLFAACSLVQSNQSAVFGYAKSDLNGDGVEELILLESKFNVLAIFTEVDGSPVLLDSYNDLRTAFIDANGRIHVKQRIIPGNEDDHEYFVYEVGKGELIEKTAVGVKFDHLGNKTEIYKLANGVKTNIEQSEWDALYAQFALDLGESSFASYTKEKSGLSFLTLDANR